MVNVKAILGHQSAMDNQSGDLIQIVALVLTDYTKRYFTLMSLGFLIWNMEIKVSYGFWKYEKRLHMQRYFESSTAIQIPNIIWNNHYFEISMLD